MKARHVGMAAGVAITAWLAFFGDKTPTGGVAEPAARNGAHNAARPAATKRTGAGVNAAPAIATTTPAANGGRKDKPRPEPVILALRPRAELIGGATSADKGDALFGNQSWVPPPPPQPKPSVPAAPTAPPLTYTYIGKKLDDAVWEVYLAKGDQTFIVREKSTIEDSYRVESIKPPLLTLTYLPLNQMQTLTIGGAD